MANAVKYHGEGYNCAESVIKAFNDASGRSIPVAIATPFGSGMAVGATCGAITGALMAAGAVVGREDAAAPNEARQYARKIMNEVQATYGTYDCLELKRQGVSCDKIIEYMEQLLERDFLDR